MRAAWPAVRVDHVEAARRRRRPEFGDVVSLRAFVALGELAPDDVDVQVAYGRVDEHDEITGAALRRRCDWPTSATTAAGSVRGRRCRSTAPGRSATRVRVLPHDALLASPAELGLVARPA